MAWRGRLGEAGDSGLELSLGLPAYFAKPSGLEAGEEPRDAAAFALQTGKGSDGSKPRVRPAAAAAPVVGWPPVRSFRRNLASSRQSPQSSSAHHQDGGVKGSGAKGGAGAGEGGHKGGLFVKINMDGVPIGRKVDLRAYGGYAELSAAVGKLFRGLLAAQRDPATAAASRRCSEEEGEAEEPVIGGEYTLVYEDEEGDRVLVGDVPWEMFVATAKRLRVLKSSDLPASSLRAGGGRKRAAADC
ncbi:Auxin-responsive protein IAA16 [Dichanthelium oligosanthes]|uniref:Auxin-responsive protein n=1 Tax=Dichanthelium oligosanthes TaxID=888268 RepID=A0A1E5VPL6_9POAL|nr:Auxin-responsive protein IAA16 [Dichanthelium oligosanthes]